MSLSSKDQIRRRLLDLREALDQAYVSEASRVIQKQALSLSQLLVAQSVALYSAFRNEVETRLLFGGLSQAGKRIVYPRLSRGQIEFLEVNDLGELRASPWGMYEPAGTKLIPVHEIDAMIVPGIAFDTEGYRVGFGYGHYDKVLKGFHGLKVGIAYDFQIVSDVTHDSWDVRCDWVITEKKMMKL